jgi:ribosomal protein S24E
MAITLRTKKIRVNKLLSRKEVIVEVFHEDKPNVPIS